MQCRSGILGRFGQAHPGDARVPTIPRARSEASALYRSPDEIARKLETPRDMGVEQVLLNGGGTSRDNLRRFAREVMPAFGTEPELRAAG